MRPLFRSIFVSAGLLAMLSFVGCARTRQARNVEFSGFLGDYSQLEKQDEKGVVRWRFVDPEVDFSAYDKLHVDTIAIYAKEGSSLAKLDQDLATRLAAEFRDALVAELGQEFTLVDEGGPGTLRLRTALVEARGSKVVLDVVSSAIPQTKLLATAGQLIADDSGFTGKAIVEAEILDSESGRRLAAGVDERYGTKVLAGGLSKWDDVQSAFRTWAEQLRENLAARRIEDRAKATPTPVAPVN
jgi:hypothetical protein